MQTRSSSSAGGAGAGAGAGCFDTSFGAKSCVGARLTGCESMRRGGGGSTALHFDAIFCAAMSLRGWLQLGHSTRHAEARVHTILRTYFIF